MMTCFDQCLDVEQQLFSKLFSIASNAKHYETNSNLEIRDFSFYSDKFSRAHLSVVDARDSKNLFLLHCTIMPNQNDPSPIFGFDIISGPKKVSGAFHDLSPIGMSPLSVRFATETSELSWNKRRPLPDWARPIFSEHIVAIGAVGSEELSRFIQVGLDTLNYYLKHIGVKTDKSYKHLHDLYCSQQRLNEATLRTLVALGMSDTEAKQFVYDNLFPL